jgi:hypothetical protein
MSTRSVNVQDYEERASSVEFDASTMYVYLVDGRVIRVPINAYERLQKATPEQRRHYRVFASGRGLRWDGLDEDLSVPGLVRDFGAFTEPSHLMQGTNVKKVALGRSIPGVENTGRRWTDADIMRLVEALQAQTPLSSIATALKRTRSAVRSKVSQLQDLQGHARK